MKLEDIKVGMKVKLLGKHGVATWYDSIEDWYEKYNEWEEVKKIQEQGYGVVRGIEDDGKIKVSYDEGAVLDTCWTFAHFDLEPYEETIEKPIQIKTPKEWLLTPLAIFTLAIGEKYITLGNGTSYIISNGKLWSRNLDEEYNEDLTDVNNYKFYDIVKITYEGKVVWERKEEIKKMTLKEIEKELGYKITIVSE